MRIHLTNLGCKLNQAEMEHLARRFESAGFQIVPALRQADLHVVNTCAVTHLAARDSRKAARRGSRLDGDLKTILTGCYVAAEPEKAAHLAGVDLVVSNHDKDRLVERVVATFGAPPPRPGRGDRLPVPFVPIEFANSRALVKIEDGCNMRCAFCIIPATRGRQRSRPWPEIAAEVGSLASAGIGEVVITGVQISAYVWSGWGLYELVRGLLEETAIPRMRLTSIAPWQFDERLLDLFVSDRLCRHIHLSLQSGCRATLQRMRRRCSPSQFEHLVERLRSAVPGIAVTTDVIVGFPGESPAEFAASMEFVERLGFARIHAFPYSPRPGTEAADMSEQIPHRVKRERMARLLDVAQRSRRMFENLNQGMQAQVLWEGRRQGRWRGMTDNYIRVSTETDTDLDGQITRVRLGAVAAEGMDCVLEPNPEAAACRLPTATQADGLTSAG